MSSWRAVYASFLTTVRAQEVFRYPCLYAQSEIRMEPLAADERRALVTGSPRDIFFHRLWTGSPPVVDNAHPDPILPGPGTGSQRVRTTRRARTARTGQTAIRGRKGDAGPESHSGPASGVA